MECFLVCFRAYSAVLCSAVFCYAVLCSVRICSVQFGSVLTPLNWFKTSDSSCFDFWVANSRLLILHCLMVVCPRDFQIEVGSSDFDGEDCYRRQKSTSKIVPFIFGMLKWLKWIGEFWEDYWIESKWCETIYDCHYLENYSSWQITYTLNWILWLIGHL